MSSLDFIRQNAAKYNNFIRASQSPSSKPNIKGGMTTSSSRFGGSYSTQAMKNVKSTLTMRTEYLPLGSSLSRQLTEQKLKSAGKKKKEKDETPDEMLYKFPTLGQIQTMTVEENPLAQKPKKKKAVASNVYGTIETELKNKSFISDHSPRSQRIAPQSPTILENTSNLEDFDTQLAAIKEKHEAAKKRLQE